VDLSYARGIHNVKLGASVGHTALTEAFSLGLTDPTVNSPCVDDAGDPSDDVGLTSVDQCAAAASLEANPDFEAGLLPFDLSRGGTNFQFNGQKGIDQQAFYVQDSLTLGPATVNMGLRVDHYAGFVTKTLAQPRAGISYSVSGSGTILRASYGRTLETPYNENLVLSSTADPAIFGTSGIPLPPGRRDHVEAGVQQAFGSWVVVDTGYFYKRTTNAYDFGTLFDTPIFFPVSWDHSRLRGHRRRPGRADHRVRLAEPRRDPAADSRGRHRRRCHQSPADRPAPSARPRPGRRQPAAQ
jgi:hypothetical protein